MAIAPPAWSPAVVQRVPLDVTVTGLTHLVEAQDGSIMEGREDGEVSEGQVVKIETEDKLRSRRGPNQELYRQFDPSEPHHFRWFKALRVDQQPVAPNLYLRDETFDTPDRNLLGSRPAKLGGMGRDRMQSGTEAMHALAIEIVNRASSVPYAGEVTAVVNKWNEGRKSGYDHDPMKTLRFMRVAYAYSVNPTILGMAQSGETENLEAVTKLLGSVTGRQFIQQWDDHAEDVENRRFAWTNLLEGVKALEGKPGLAPYLDETLVHDKGYAQTLESAGLYLLYLDFGATEAPPMEEEPFGRIVARGLARIVNTNIWDGGMLNSGKISVQLERKSTTVSQQSIAPATQEGNMWTQVLTALVRARTQEPDWSYVLTIRDNQQTLFDTVRAIVPTSFPLSMDSLGEALTKLGG